MEYLLIGFKDYALSINKPMKWLFVGFMDIALKYKRTILGPWWNTLGIALIISVLSSIWSSLLKTDINFFIPYFTIGFIVWNWFSTTLIDTSTCLVEVEGIIKQLKIPLTTLLLRVSVRNGIVFLHNSILILVVIFLFKLDVMLTDFLIITIPGIFLIFLSMNSIGIMLALVSLRYRDVSNLIFFVLQILFFLTPVLWHPDLLDKKQILVEFNPFFYWVDIIRQPILGLEIHSNSLLFLTISSVFLFFVSCYMAGKYKNKLIYWL